MHTDSLSLQAQVARAWQTIRDHLFKKEVVLKKQLAPHRSRPLDRIRNSAEYNPCRTSWAPYGFYKGRFIIGECTRVNGGIYLSSSGNEEIVVDESHGTLSEVYNLLVSRLSRRGIIKDRASEYQIVAEAIKIASETLAFKHEDDEALSYLRTLADGQKVSLDLYLQEGIGGARHQILLLAYLLEKLRDAKVVYGCTYIDSVGSTHRTAAERLIYTSPNGDFIYFEPATLQSGPTAIADELLV
jgi:hypothetical protein